VPGRQQTLEATLDWSHQLLTGPEQIVLRRLAVFAGGWDLEAAESVCAGDGIDEMDVLELLQRLIDKSLVLADTQAGAARYRLLETVRAYAAERLSESGERDLLRQRHLNWCLALAEQAEMELRGVDQRTWIVRLKREQANVRVALIWVRETQAAEVGLRIAGALTWFWGLCGQMTEGRLWIDELLQANVSPSGHLARAKSLRGAGFLAWLQGDCVLARRQLEESASIAKDAGDPRALVETLTGLSVVCWFQGELETVDLLTRECFALSHATGNQWTLAQAWHTRGVLQLQTGDLAAAQHSLEEKVRLSREMGDTFGVAVGLVALGDTARAAGDDVGALSRYELGLRLLRELDITFGIPDLVHNLGHIALHQDDTEKANQLFRVSLAGSMELDDRRGVAQCLVGLAGVARAYGAPERAARLLGTARATFEALGTSPWPGNTPELERIEAETQDALGVLAFSEAFAAGRNLTLEDAVAESRVAAGPASVELVEPRDAGGDPVEPISQREREVATLIGRGLANREIANTLVIAERTVESHVTHILAKLGLRSRSQIAVWAAGRGLLDECAD
jgi:DNA-binding CsgD family transcriptional regulator